MVTSFLSEIELLELGFAKVGKNVQISKFARFYGQSNLSISDNVRIDDFAVIATGDESKIDSFVHIAAHVVISAPLGFEMGENSTISSRCAIYGQSDDFSGEFLTNPTVSSELRGVSSAKIRIGAHVIIGTGSTILPNVTVAEGTALGAMSLLKTSTESWSIYAGIPSRKIKSRKRNELDRLN